MKEEEASTDAEKNPPASEPEAKEPVTKAEDGQGEGEGEDKGESEGDGEAAPEPLKQYIKVCLFTPRFPWLLRLSCTLF